jgi:hypothetical protein
LFFCGNRCQFCFKHFSRQRTVAATLGPVLPAVLSDAAASEIAQVRSQIPDCKGEQTCVDDLNAIIQNILRQQAN